MAWIEREGTRTWRVRWREGGKVLSSERYHAKADAVQAARQIEARLRAAKPLRRRPVLGWREVRERYLRNMAERGCTDRSIAEARRVLDAFHAESVASMMPEDVQSLGLGAHRVVRAALRYAASRLGVPIDPALLAPRDAKHRPRPEAPLLGDDEVARLQAKADAWAPTNGALVHLVAVYGHRPQSLVGLRGIALAGGRLHLQVKSGDQINHPLTRGSLDRLEPLAALAGPDGHLLPSHLGRPWKDGREFSAWFFHATGVGIYRLKAAAITRMHAAGLDLATIASITGHRTKSVLLRYARTNDRRQEAAVAVLERMGAPGQHPGN